MPVFAPAEWRINGASAGLYTVERNSERGWRLEGVFLSLAQAFEFAERLHGPVSGGLKALCEPAGVGEPSNLPECYRVSTETSWRGRIYQNALEANPFTAVTDPSEAFRHAKWLQARASALEALRRWESVILAGEAGTGKSLLLLELARTLERQGWSPRVAGEDVLLVDAPDSVAPEPGRAPLVVAGSAGAAAGSLRAPGPTTTVTLQNLSPEDVARFIVARFSASGRYADSVEPGAALALALQTGGRLREVNMLAGMAVFLADLECAPRILLRHVEDAVALRNGGAPAVAVLDPAFSNRAVQSAPQQARAVLGAAVAGVFLVFVSGWAAYRVVAPLAQARVAESDVPIVMTQTAQSVGDDLANAALPIPSAEPGAESGLREASAEDTQARSATRGAEVGTSGPLDQPESARSDAISEPVKEPPNLPQRSEDLGPPAQFSVAGSFRGPVNNETMDQSGRLALVISRADPSGAIKARFHASEGLIGSGELAGKLTANGHISASGQLMMGKNPFNCNLDGFIQGGRLVGSAQFVRPWGGRVFRSSFALSRS